MPPHPYHHFYNTQSSMVLLMVSEFLSVRQGYNTQGQSTKETQIGENKVMAIASWLVTLLDFILKFRIISGEPSMATYFSLKYILLYWPRQSLRCVYCLMETQNTAVVL